MERGKNDLLKKVQDDLAKDATAISWIIVLVLVLYGLAYLILHSLGFIQ